MKIQQVLAAGAVALLTASAFSVATAAPSSAAQCGIDARNGSVFYDCARGGELIAVQHFDAVPNPLPWWKEHCLKPGTNYIGPLYDADNSEGQIHLGGYTTNMVERGTGC